MLPATKILNEKIRDLGGEFLLTKEDEMDIRERALIEALETQHNVVITDFHQTSDKNFTGTTDKGFNFSYNENTDTFELHVEKKKPKETMKNLLSEIWGSTIFDDLILEKEVTTIDEDTRRLDFICVSINVPHDASPPMVLTLLSDALQPKKVEILDELKLTVEEELKGKTDNPDIASMITQQIKLEISNFTAHDLFKKNQNMLVKARVSQSLTLVELSQKTVDNEPVDITEIRHRLDNIDDNVKILSDERDNINTTSKKMIEEVTVASNMLTECVKTMRAQMNGPSVVSAKGAVAMIMTGITANVAGRSNELKLGADRSETISKYFKKAVEYPGRTRDFAEANWELLTR